MNQAIIQLEIALQAFAASKNVAASVDLNGDKNAVWSKYNQADTIGDGKIDIADIAEITEIARLILGKPCQPECGCERRQWWEGVQSNGHWAKASFQEAIKLGFIEGNTDATFRLNGQTTRSKFSDMLSRALKLKVSH